LEVQSEDTGPDVWQIEVDTPSNMERHGWFRDSLGRGDKVEAQVFPPKNADEMIAKLFAIVKEDGTRLSYIDSGLLDSDAPVGNKADGLSGTWAPNQLAEDSRVTELQEQLIFLSYGMDVDLPLTEAAINAVRSFTDELSPTLDCVPRTAPSITMTSSGLHSIEVREDVVTLRENWFGTERTVHMDLTSHEGAAYSIQGHSIGRWEGDVLVVDTARFSEHREGLFAKTPSSRDKHLIERFELSSDGQSLAYSWEVTDPMYLTAPVSGRNRWTYRPDLKFATVKCSLESARRFLED
jgi:hypothetical protein